MRLTSLEHTAILSTLKTFDKDAEVYLFGSRVDDSKKGGDIDLLVMSDTISCSDKTAIRIKLFELLEEQKVDLVIASDDADPFVRVALEAGVKL